MNGFIEIVLGLAVLYIGVIVVLGICGAALTFLACLYADVCGWNKATEYYEED